MYIHALNLYCTCYICTSIAFHCRRLFFARSSETKDVHLSFCRRGPSLDKSLRSSLSSLCLICPFLRTGANRNSLLLHSFLSTFFPFPFAKAFQLCALRYSVSNPTLVFVPLLALFVLFLFRFRAIHVFDFFSPQPPVLRAHSHKTYRIDRLCLSRLLTFDVVAVNDFSTLKTKEKNVFFSSLRKILCCVFFVFFLESTKTWRKNPHHRYHCYCYHSNRHDDGDDENHPLFFSLLLELLS